MKLLVISYYWPPAGGPGVQRWLKTALALQDQGHDVEVLTVDPKAATYPLKDMSLLKESESLTVHHSGATDWFKRYQQLTRRKEVPFSGFANQAGTPGPLQKLSRFIRGNCFLPDPRKGWNKQATALANKLLQSKDWDLIITTGPPHSTHLIGQTLQKTHGITWWADFRDPWTDIYYYDQFYPTQWARKKDMAMEQSVLSQAERILCVSEDLKRLLSSKVKRSSDDFHIMPNGYDPKDFSDTASQPSNEAFTLAYTGTLTLQYPLDALYKAIQGVIDASQAINLVIAGRPAKECVDQLQQMARVSNGLFSFKALGYLPHAESVKVLERANALLLLIPDLPNNKGILTGKLFEYIGSGRPIWGFGPDGSDAQAILDKVNAGKLHEDPNKASQQLLSWMHDCPSGASQSDKKAYTRAGLAKALMA